VVFKSLTAPTLPLLKHSIKAPPMGRFKHLADNQIAIHFQMAVHVPCSLNYSFLKKASPFAFQQKWEIFHKKIPRIFFQITKK